MVNNTDGQLHIACRLFYLESTQYSVDLFESYIEKQHVDLYDLYSSSFPCIQIITSKDQLVNIILGQNM